MLLKQLCQAIFVVFMPFCCFRDFFVDFLILLLYSFCIKGGVI
nr:MAG TPA: hypothetical protein [Caudoviricetes sp.]